MEGQKQSMADSLDSNLPDVIQNLQSLLDKLQSISAEDQDSRKEQLYSFVSTARPAVKALLDDVGIPPRAVAVMHKPSRQKEKRKPTSENSSLSESKGKLPSRAKGKIRNSPSFPSGLQPVRDKSSNHKRRSVPQELLVSPAYLHEETKHQERLDQPQFFTSLLGDTAEPIAPDHNASSSDSDAEHPPSDHEEPSAASVHRYCVQLEKQKATLTDQLLHLEMKAKSESESLRDDLDTCTHERNSLLSQCETVKCQLARKEKECYKLYRLACSEGDMAERDRIEFKLWNVEVALKWCHTNMDSRAVHEYAIKNIVKLAKRVECLEKERPWTS
jgi:ElaB/YqjD/DUF883 family membrane-anchored ribosome-binding protein